jgi:hypothetical protein
VLIQRKLLAAAELLQIRKGEAGGVFADGAAALVAQGRLLNLQQAK